jgi:hypothetical protein
MELTDTNKPCGLSISSDWKAAEYSTIRLSIFYRKVPRKRHPCRTATRTFMVCPGWPIGLSLPVRSGSAPAIPLPGTLIFSVVIAKRSHPFPFRTRKLSSSAPMVLHGRLCGRVGRRRILTQKASMPHGIEAFSFSLLRSTCILSIPPALPPSQRGSAF